MERPLPPNAPASQADAMEALWKGAGLKDVEMREITVTVSFDDVDDFCDANFLPSGPQAKLMASMSESTREALRERLREFLPVGQDGRISYEAWANAAKGRVA
jgi:hypothetical protein